MPFDAGMPGDLLITSGTNQEFLERYARPGLIALAGGESLSSRLISRAQRHLIEDEQYSRWSHAFFFEGLRADGQHWVVESDVQIKRKHIRMGVQENRLSKYYDGGYYRRLALLDFNLSEGQLGSMLARALELVAANARYSLRELMGTLLGLRHQRWRARENVLARSSSFFCSAFVAHLLHAAGLEVNAALDEKHTTPEDIFRAIAPHTTILLDPGAAAIAPVG